MAVVCRISPALSLFSYAVGCFLLCFLLFVRPVQAQRRCALQLREVLGEGVAAARRRLEGVDSYLHRFVREEEFRRRVLRERFGYAESGEWVYIFED
ncbi:MAG: hypothetical protein LBT98_01700 [Puniceicoccales bacterium]|jgi:hypothetical protein|nr:hypothetical protein [Puniceicoccales bacterium]